MGVFGVYGVWECGARECKGCGSVWGVGVYGVWDFNIIMLSRYVMLFYVTLRRYFIRSANFLKMRHFERFSHIVLKTYQRGLACFDKLIFATLTFGILRRCGGAFFAVVFHCFDVR